MLEIRKLCCAYGNTEILHSIALTVPHGRITVIAGPNGSGKSTLLKAIAGIHPAKTGSVLLDGMELRSMESRKLARRVAYLAQSRQVPEITAERLVLHGRFPYLSYPRRYRKEDMEISQRAMESMGISDLADRYMNTLSGGQRQKVYIAMALAQDTPVVLMDEPNTFLDIAHQMQLMDQARALADLGKTVVLVLQDLALAMKCADHLAVLDRGRILIQGTPEAVFESGCLEQAFGVGVARVRTDEGWQYYYRERG